MNVSATQSSLRQVVSEASRLGSFQAVFYAGLITTDDDNFTAEDAEIAEFITFSAEPVDAVLAGLRRAE